LSASRDYLALPLAVWLATAGLGVAVIVRGAVFGLDGFVRDFVWAAIAAAGGSAGLAAYVTYDRFDFALDLRSRLWRDEGAVRETVRRVLERETRVLEQREFPRGLPALRYYGLWPGVRFLPGRTGFRCADGLTFVLQSMSEPATGEPVAATLLSRAGESRTGRADPGRGRAVLLHVAEAWLNGEAAAPGAAPPDLPAAVPQALASR
jgi:hypothetical protein